MVFELKAKRWFDVADHRRFDVAHYRRFDVAHHGQARGERCSGDRRGVSECLRERRASAAAKRGCVGGREQNGVD